MNGQTVCLLNDSFPPVIDGVANAVVNYGRYIPACGGRVLIATPAVPEADDSVFDFPVLRYPSVDVRKQLGYVAGYPFSPALVARAREDQTALLHTHCPISSCLLARSLREELDVPVVLTYHTKFDVEIAKALRGKLLRDGAVHALVQNIEACDEVWVVSRGAGENLRSLGYEGDYIVMENGVDIPRGRVSDAQLKAVCGVYDLPENVPVFLFVGRMMWYKGLRIILDGLKMLGEDFRMVFVGDGAERQEVQDYAEKLGLSEKCVFTGALTDRESLRSWYSRADLFLFPSTFDTNGLVVREAAACGTATVMVADSCAAEGVTDGQNGFLIEENAEALAACLKRLSASPETVRRVGENASRELYISWEDAVAHACERYETVIDNYRCGLYVSRRRPMDGFFKVQGELMETLADVRSERRELQSELEAVRHVWQNGLDLVRHEMRKELRTVKQTFWDKIDRYL